MFKVRGKLKILNDGKVREITVDNGKITGDEMFKFELGFVLNALEKNHEPIRPPMYYPEGKYHEDNIAVLLTVKNICNDILLSGELPVLPELGEGEIG